MIDAIMGAKNEIIGGIVLALLAWAYHKFRVLMKLYKQKKQELERINDEMLKFGATKEEVKRLQEALSQAESQQQELKSQLEAAQAELQRKDEALRQAEEKSQEDSRRIEELKRQIEALQQELEREKAKKKLPPMNDDDFLRLCKSGDARKVEEAIMNGANVNAKNTFGNTALIEAVMGGRYEIAEMLLKYSADINAKNNYGNTALDIAKSWKRGKIAALLRAYGAK